MRTIKKNIQNIPISLLDNKRKATFNLIKDLKRYPNDNKDYKTAEIFKQLKTIYNNKCAFCEDTLLNSPNHIEHYRPKNKNERIKKCYADTSYFWLSFSWDNLLLTCGSCNSSKGTCFNIQGTKANYEQKYINYSLDNLQNIIKELDSIEKPLLVNPEQEEQMFFDENLIFTISGKILSKNMRLRYTIRICNLNRNGLIKLRLKLINSLRDRIRRRKADYWLSGDKKAYIRDIALIHKDWQDMIMNNPKFSALYKYFDKYFNEFIKTITN